MVVLLIACAGPSTGRDSGIGECAPDASEQTRAFYADVGALVEAWGGCKQDADCALVSHPDPRLMPFLSINQTHVSDWEAAGEALYSAYWEAINGEACGPWESEPDNAAHKWTHCEACRCKVTINLDDLGVADDTCLP